MTDPTTVDPLDPDSLDVEGSVDDPSLEAEHALQGEGLPAAGSPTASPTGEEPPTSDPGGNGSGAPLGSGEETEVACPGCGLTLIGESPRPTAAWFCPRCDYPLFWASGPAPAAEPATRAARRRLPGTGGRIVLGAEPCWHCGEMSEPGDHECGRCAATLPKPLAPKVLVDVPVPVPVPYAARPVVWPWVAAALCGGAAIASAVTSWLSGGL